MLTKLLHRGWYGIFPENSLESIKKAFLSNFHGIETDIQITKDNIWVLHHDENLNRLFKLDKKMNYYNYSEIGNINWKDKLTKYKLPKLSSLIKLAKSYQKIVNLEIKVKFSEISKKNTIDLKNIIYNYKYNVIISSFNWDWYPWCLKYNFTFAHLIEKDKNLPIDGNFFIFSKNETNYFKKLQNIQNIQKIGVYTLNYQEQSDIPFQIIDPPK